MQNKYSYAPWGNSRDNRSRIDFFLISENIIQSVDECLIKPSVQSKLFEHKAILLSFKKKKPVVSRPTISNKILRDPDIEIVVKLAAYECYIQVSNDNVFKERILPVIGRAYRLLRLAGPDGRFLNYSHASLIDIDSRANFTNELRVLCDELEGENILGREITMEDDVFLEYLVNNIRNEMVSYQSFIFKKVDESYENLVSKIENLKKNAILNQNLISEYELKLREMNEIKINAVLEGNPNFNQLNSERITPFFLKITNGSQLSGSMWDIIDPDGAIFESALRQKSYIPEYFANSYKRPVHEPENLTGCIETFLGPEILNHPLTQNLKLNEAERIRLDQDLTGDELDHSLERANLSSAAGIDGLSTKIIKKFWYIFKLPLLNYTKCVFRNGRLTQSFKTALIKLIPKKGNSADIKKWRPISLLSCLYKIVSRAINNRLKSVVNRFTSREQKGFTKHRYIQEVLINVCETIRYCDTNNIGAALVSVDQSRAFDTISHKYMAEVYKFFGFGEHFVNMMDTLGNNRNASIIFEDGTISENFDLETGPPQGDGPSTLQYNMGEEILLLKIELDPLVASVFQHALAPRFAMDLVLDPRRRGLGADYNEHLCQESNRETDKADGFADDNSNAVKTEFESLNRLKILCHEFSLFSGLQSNVEKTTLLKIGSTDVLSQEVLNLGFNITDEIVLLGMTINRKLDSLSNHFDDVILKITRLIEFWDRFKLSMCGRIYVCKTFMISQIGYLGCIITPSGGQTNRLQKLLDDFCTGTSRIAKKKLYMPPNLGGLGLIKISDYIISLQCSWIKRTMQHWGDNWRYDI
jgi:hypothetical protein